MKEFMEGVQSWWAVFLAAIAFASWLIKGSFKTKQNSKDLKTEVGRLESEMVSQGERINELYTKQEESSKELIEIRTIQNAMNDTMKEGFKRSREDRRDLKESLERQHQEVMTLIRKS